MDITPLEAIGQMRKLAEANVPFSFTYMSYNGSKHESDGVKVVHKAILRKGLRNDQSKKADTLIAYTDHSWSEKPRFFHLALLLTFNDYTVKP
ncbi:hypothetical protein [Flavobacterium psychrotrophum]|uniref:hypothetical protein n=1 Tax=Flavobacterium psychrotrophum TaxID=2294119 RepID=UPI000E312BBB|nr:hypothetical protein [Flavobacterium psychrotrophum]